MATTQPDPSMLNAWYQNYLQSPPKTQQATATQWTPDASATVAGQFNNITAKGSPLMDMAETSAAQKANARGLLNSSIAVGEGQKAAYSAALPIAQQDAATFARAGEFNAGQSNQTSQFNAGQTNQALGQQAQAGTQGFLNSQKITADQQAQEAQFAQQTKLQKTEIEAQAERQREQLEQQTALQDAANKFTLTRDAQQFQNRLTEINAETDAAIKLYDSQNGTKLYETYRATSQQTYDAYISAVQQIQTSDMDPDVKAAQIANLQTMFSQRQDFINLIFAEAPQWAEEWSQFAVGFGG